MTIDPIHGSLTQLEDLGMLLPKMEEILKLAINAEISPVRGTAFCPSLGELEPASVISLHVSVYMVDLDFKFEAIKWLLHCTDSSFSQ